MEGTSVERRRERRVPVQALLLIRHAEVKGPKPFSEQVAKDVSLAGVYFEAEDGAIYNVNDVVIASVSIPEDQRRDFPFARLAGHGRVVRMNDLAPQDGGRKRFGIAIEFSGTITSLTAIPIRH